MYYYNNKLSLQISFVMPVWWMHTENKLSSVLLKKLWTLSFGITWQKSRIIKVKIVSRIFDICNAIEFLPVKY